MPRLFKFLSSKIYKLDSEVHFLNSGGRNDVRFVSVTKNNLCLYDLICEYNKNEPRIQLINRRQIPSFYDDPDVVLNPFSNLECLVYLSLCGY